MKCISCEVDINPQWKHAIDINVCPFCGKHIMEEHLKNLFASLRETVDKLQQYPDQLNDWMLSNHNYIKTDSAQISQYMPKEMLKEIKKVQDDKDFQERKKFTVKVKTETGEEEVQAEKIQSEETTNEFFKRAEVIKNVSHPSPPSPNAAPVFTSPEEKTQHFKKVVQQIKKIGSSSINESGGTDIISPEMMDSADPEAVAEFQSMMSGGEVVSSLDSEGLDDDLPGGDFILQANLAAAAKGGGGGSGGQANAKDLAHLKRLQSKMSQARQNVQSGAKGSFSRS